MALSVLSGCPGCGAKNRIPLQHLADTGRCGVCKAVLPPATEPLEVDEPMFGEILRTARVPVLVDFWAAWCGPCRMAAPEVAAIAREFSGRALVLKVDTEKQPVLAERYQIQSIPLFIVFRGGRPVRESAGLASRSEMREWIQAA